MTLSTQEWRDLFGQHNLLFLGCVDLGLSEDFPRFKKWLDEGKHAGMTWLENHDKLREDPRHLLDNGKSAMSFALPYYQGDSLFNRPAPGIAQYARMQDYHKYMWKVGGEIGQVIQTRFPGTEFRVVVDTAPLLERSVAARTPRGFIGKNTLFIHPEVGSFLMLGEIILNQDSASYVADHSKIEVDPDQRTTDGGCGSCKRCAVHCPTGALDVPYQLDANKCISYWTIEHRGELPEHVWPWLKEYVFGCDLCQLACPYNRSQTTEAPEHLVRDFSGLDLTEIATMDQRSYEKWFGGSSVTRAKREGMMRNALIALYIRNDQRLEEVLDRVESLEVPEVVNKTSTSIRQKLSAIN